MHKTIFTVTGLTCGGCVARVKSTLSTFADEVVVTLDPPEATLANCKADMETLNAALSQVGNYQLHANPASQGANNLDAKTAPNADTNQIKHNGEINNGETNNGEKNKSWLTTYFPLLLILAFIVLVSVLVQLSPIFAGQTFDFMQWMMHFMAGFFLVFAFFKLLDIRGFADSYAMYDLLAMRIKAYGYIYPFIELGLGIAYLLAWQPLLTNAITFFVMVFSSLGVIRAVLNQQKIRCACLGAVFNLPMSTVTIIEDLLMAGMALWMLL